MISKLIPGMTNVNIVGKVISKGEKRTVRTKFGKTKVCDAIIKDDTGEITLTLWSDQISMVKEGETISVQGGYITEWQGEFQLNIPKRGSIEKQAQLC